MRKLFVIIVLFSTFTKAYSQESPSTMSAEEIIFYYDVSYSMRDRNIDAEINFLDSYFTQHPEAEVTLFQMSTALNDTSTHTVSSGNWDTLKTAIITTDYDGASDFSLVNFIQKVNGFLLSTDGELSISKLPKASTIPITAINTVRKDKGDLRWLTKSSGGTYEEFLDVLTEEQVAEVKVKAKVKRVTQQSIKTLSTQNPSELDAVTIKGAGDNSDREEYNTIDVSGIKYDKKKLGYSVEKITDKEISELDVDAKQAVKGQFAGIEVSNNTAVTKSDLGQFLGRHKNMSMLGDQTGLVVIDGVPQSNADSSVRQGDFLYGVDYGNRGGTTSNINPDNIESVTYLKGLAATNRYGTLGKGGVIEIVTKTGGGSSSKMKKNKKVLGTTPTYTGAATLMSDLPNTDYIEALTKTTDLNGALSTYLEYRATNGDEASFFLNVARYFKGWKKPDITERILSNVTEVADNDISTLRALSYVYEDTNNYQSQVALAEHILYLDSKNAQSYLDLARAYRLSGNNDLALEMFNKIVSPSGLSGVNFAGIKETTTKEYKQFVATSGKGLPVSKILPAYRAKPAKLARRIVVEYSDPEALFDLKIINPQNRFFTWSHTTTGEAARLLQEKQQGFNQEEFFLTETDKGQWRFNIINYGTTNINALGSTFLKITVFKNWGSTNQSREVKLIQLSELNKEEQVLSLSI